MRNPDRIRSALFLTYGIGLSSWMHIYCHIWKIVSMTKVFWTNIVKSACLSIIQKHLKTNLIPEKRRENTRKKLQII